MSAPMFTVVGAGTYDPGTEVLSIFAPALEHGLNVINNLTDERLEAYNAYWAAQDLPEYHVLTCDACGRIGNEDDGIEIGGPCQEPCTGTVREVQS